MQLRAQTCRSARVYMSEATFHEWVKIKDGRGCSEEVVAKGKGHARKTGRRRRGRAPRPTNQRAVRSSVPPPPRPVVRNSPATHGRQLGMARTVYAWRVSLGLKIYDCLILDYCCLQTTKIKKYVTSQYWAFTIDIIWYYYNKEYFLVMILYTK